MMSIHYVIMYKLGELPEKLIYKGFKVFKPFLMNESVFVPNNFINWLFIKGVRAGNIPKRIDRQAGE